MLTINPETVCYIIVKAREFDSEVLPDELGSGSNPSDDRDVAILEATANNPVFQELVSALEDVNDDELTELLALVLVGRGDFARDEWASALQQAQELNRAESMRRLAATPLLGDLLEEGLTVLGDSCDDVELDHL